MTKRNPLKELLDHALEGPEPVHVSELFDEESEPRGEMRDSEWPGQVLLTARRPA